MASKKCSINQFCENFLVETLEQCKSKEDFKELSVSDYRNELEVAVTEEFGMLNRFRLDVIDLFEEKLYEARDAALAKV